MTRREMLQLGAAGGAGAVLQNASAAATDGRLAAGSPASAPAFEWEEAGVEQLQAAMTSGNTTAVALTEQFLERIAAVDKAGPNINAVIELNPDAAAIARALDEERKTSGPRGPLHGIPVMVKDNLDTHDRMMTTAGSLALVGSIAPRDSFVVQRLRAAGAVLLGKTNLSEWANFRSSNSTSGWSGRGGLTRNPYALDRNPSGSSSGSAAAVSANLCCVAIGTETDGSIISPASVCGVVGVKPTLGLVSRAGIIPIAHSQDTAGPMTRSVRDAALLLSAIAGPDPRDPATAGCEGKLHRDYTRFLDPDGLRGARVGVARKLFHVSERAKRVIEAGLEVMKHLGATIVDPTDLPGGREFGNAEIEVLLYEFKADLNTYLAGLGPGAPVRSLAEVIAFNEANADREMQYFGQELFLRAEAKGPLTEQAYLDALAKCRRVARAEGLDAVMDRHSLDAVVAPSNGPAAATDLVYGDRDLGGTSTVAAVAGYPNITVPAGAVVGLPVAISFMGRAWSEPTLLKLAYAFEQATKARTSPRFLKGSG